MQPQKCWSQSLTALSTTRRFWRSEVSFRGRCCVAHTTISQVVMMVQNKDLTNRNQSCNLVDRIPSVDKSRVTCRMKWIVLPWLWSWQFEQCSLATVVPILYASGVLAVHYHRVYTNTMLRFHMRILYIINFQGCSTSIRWTTFTGTWRQPMVHTI